MNIEHDSIISQETGERASLKPSTVREKYQTESANKEALRKRLILNDISSSYKNREWKDLNEGEQSLVKAFGGLAPWDEVTEALMCSNDSYMKMLIWAGIMPPEYEDSIQAEMLELYAKAINENPEKTDELNALFGVKPTNRNYITNQYVNETLQQQDLI